MTINNNFEVIPSGAALGADIVGLDLKKPIDKETFERVIDAWNEHLVLRFRNQMLSEEEFVRFSGYFGSLDDGLMVCPGHGTYHPRSAKINVVSNIVLDGVAVGVLGSLDLDWHQENAYKSLPPKASIFYGIETPETGDTHFCNLNSAYENLPEELIKKIKGLSCKHDATRNLGNRARPGFDEKYDNVSRPGAIHPLVIKHHATGKEFLFVGRRRNAWIVGLTDKESDELLDEIWAHIEDGSHHWSQRWQPDDIVLWNNRYTLHRRGELDERQSRLLHRIQIRDDTPPIASL